MNTSPYGLRRRALLQAMSAAGLSSLVASWPLRARAAAPSDEPWSRAATIIARLTKPPVFRDEDFLITSYGAAPCPLVQVRAWVNNDDQEQVSTPAPGAHDSHGAIAAAVNACRAAGGGRVVIPAGNWYCAGPIALRSKVHVHLKAGAHIYFSNNPADYAKYGSVDCGENGKLVRTRWQGNDCLNFSSMVYAYGETDIALTGEDWTSILDGQGGLPFTPDAGGTAGAACWWSWKGRNPVAKDGTAPIYTKGQPSEVAPNPRNPASIAVAAPTLSAFDVKLIEGENLRWRGDFGYLPALSEAGIAVDQRIFGLGHFLRPHMVQFISCTNVWLQGYQINNSPFWQHNPVDCQHMLVRDVYANSLGPNNDGFDPESCRDVLIDHCTFNTGDDCIAINAGKDRDTGFGPARDIVIQRCTMQSGHGALTLGSEMAAGIENVYAQDLVFQNVNWASNPLNIAIRLKTNLNRGGYLKNMYVRRVNIPNGIRTVPAFYAPLPGAGIAAGSVATTAGGLITIDCDYAPHEDNVRTRPPSVSNVHISQVTVGDVATPQGHYSCYQALVIQGPVAADYNGPAPAPAVPPVTDVFISDCHFGTVANAAHPWYLDHAKNIVLKNVSIGGARYDTTLNSTSTAAP
jgi:polygalacturonase